MLSQNSIPHLKLVTERSPKANLSVEKNMLRYKLMREENEEYLEAANANDLVEVADALRRYALHPLRYYYRTWPST